LRSYLCVIALLAFGPRQQAQTVQPVIVQYQGSAHGKFELVNNSLEPLDVVLQPRSFNVTLEGEGVFVPLSNDIHLKLSAMSFRIPPQQSRFVFYEANADHLPAWFVIYSLVSGRPSQSGINVELELPHTVYLLQKQAIDRNDLLLESAEYNPEQHRVIVTVLNSSSKLGRAIGWQVTSKHAKNSGGGFPLLPQSRRRLELEWNSPNPPQTVQIQFQHFTLKQDLPVHEE
jgi:hypothetical protein